jgi:hypothetical protein
MYDFLNLQNTTFPVKISDIATFEKHNMNLSINVYSFENKQTKKPTDSNCEIYPLYISNNLNCKKKKFIIYSKYNHKQTGTLLFNIKSWYTVQKTMQVTH